MYINIPKKWPWHYIIRAILYTHKPLLLLSVIFSNFTIDAQFPGKIIETDCGDTITPILQVSINTLTDNTELLTWTKLLDDSFSKSHPLFGSGIRMGIDRFVKADFIRDFDDVGDAYKFELGSIAVNGSPVQLDLSVTKTFHIKHSRILT
jgi:hypothetical protein